MDDGTVHAVGSVVGHYLIIDGDTFDADVENQAEWENYVLKGDSASPIDMADRLSYALYGMTTGGVYARRGRFRGFRLGNQL